MGVKKLSPRLMDDPEDAVGGGRVDVDRNHGGVYLSHQGLGARGGRSAVAANAISTTHSTHVNTGEKSTQYKKVKEKLQHFLYS
jgi:hypothetical protein